MAAPVNLNRNSRIRIQHLRNCRGIKTLTGPETHLLDLAHNIDHSRFDLRIAVVVENDNPDNMFVNRLQTTDVKVDVIPTLSPLDFSDLHFLKRTLKQNKTDVLVSHDARSDVIAWHARRRQQVPWIAFAHGWVNWERWWSKSRLYAQLEIIAVRRADIALVASAHMHRNLLQLGNAAGRIRCIPIGIDVDRYSQPVCGTPVRDELGIPPTAPVVGLVGRIHPCKGQTVFVQAASEVLRTHQDTYFVLVGDIAFPKHRPYRESIESLIQQLNIGHRVILTGTRQDIPEVMAALDICAVPSIQEPYGLVAIEAQAAGAPVIASDVGGLTEIVANGVSGYLMPPGDAGKLAATIVELLDDEAGRVKMGQMGRQRAAERFSIRTMIGETEMLYAGISSSDN